MYKRQLTETGLVLLEVIDGWTLAEVNVYAGKGVTAEKQGKATVSPEDFPCMLKTESLSQTNLAVECGANVTQGSFVISHAPVSYKNLRAHENPEPLV